MSVNEPHAELPPDNRAPLFGRAQTAATSQARMGTNHTDAVPEPPIGDSVRLGPVGTAFRPDANKHVNDFRRIATPPSQRLATLLSGVLHPPVHDKEESTWDTSVLTFPADAQDLLPSGGRRSETAGVVRVAAAHFGEAIPVLGHLRNAISDPDNTADPARSQENSADVALESVVMRALSGPNLSRADRH
ncbi:MAG: hypothetical protein ACRDSK_13995 [Actinophytocola sp.]|uniref:hypothetical protein n=1 Tax=Actinophytocola sp. TaxID=1872138 RepID=UPI003D6A1A3A